MTHDQLITNLRESLNELRERPGFVLLGFRDSPGCLAQVPDGFIERLLAEVGETTRKVIQEDYIASLTESVVIQLLMSSAGLSHLIPENSDADAN